MEDQGFGTFIWGFVSGSPLQNRFTTIPDIPSETALSNRISTELKNKGFKFCGPKTVYAFMQAVGIVNDDVVDCPWHEKTASLGSESQDK